VTGTFGTAAGSLPCPCGSGASYDECCGPLHRGETAAETAEQLMRSRYSAHHRGLEDYLLATWHPTTRPAGVELDPGVRWLRLEVLDTRGGTPTDSDGEVEFTAHYRDRRGRQEGRLHERSRFTRRGGRWFYLDGTVD